MVVGDQVPTKEYTAVHGTGMVPPGNGPFLLKRQPPAHDAAVSDSVFHRSLMTCHTHSHCSAFWKTGQHPLCSNRYQGNATRPRLATLQSYR